MDIKGILSYNDKNLETNITTYESASYDENLYNINSINKKQKEFNFKLFTAFENLLAFNFDFVTNNIVDTYTISKPEHLFFFTPEQEWEKIRNYYYKNIFAKRENITEIILHLYKEHSQILKEIRKYYPDFCKNEKEKMSNNDYQLIFALFIKLHALINKTIYSNDIIRETTFNGFLIIYNYELSKIKYEVNSIISTNDYKEANLLKLNFINSELQKFIDIVLKKYITLDETDSESIKIKKLVLICTNVINDNNEKINSINNTKIKRYI